MHSRLNKLLAAIIIGIIFSVNIALACKCVPHSTQECFNHSSVVLRGKVVTIKDYVENDSIHHRRATIAVSEKWKGEPTDSIAYEETGSNCDFIFSEGREYLIFGDIKNHLLDTNKCTATKLWLSAKKEIEEVKKLSAVKK